MFNAIYPRRNVPTHQVCYANILGLNDRKKMLVRLNKCEISFASGIGRDICKKTRLNLVKKTYILAYNITGGLTNMNNT